MDGGFIFRKREFVPLTYTLNPDMPDVSILDQAAACIRAGGVVIFPAESLYGLGANALDPAAVDRVFAVKGRPAEKPLLVLVSGLEDIAPLVWEVPLAARRIMDAFWPGGLTLIFHAAASLPENLTAGTGKIGIRLPASAAARHLARLAGVPITGTSANLSGEPAVAGIRDISPRVLGEADIVLDAGTLTGGAGSTIVDVTETPPRILREGLIPAARIFSALTSAANSVDK